MATPHDWEITQAELYAILTYLDRLIERHDNETSDRKVLICTDCLTGIRMIEKVMLTGHCSGRNDMQATVEAICTTSKKFKSLLRDGLPELLGEV